MWCVRVKVFFWEFFGRGKCMLSALMFWSFCSRDLIFGYAVVLNYYMHCLTYFTYRSGLFLLFFFFLYCVIQDFETPILLFVGPAIKQHPSWYCISYCTSYAYCFNWFVQRTWSNYMSDNGTAVYEFQYKSILITRKKMKLPREKNNAVHVVLFLLIAETNSRKHISYC